MLSPLDCLPAKAGGAVNCGAYAPFILTVDWLDWLCYFLDKLEVVLMHRQSSIPFNQSGIGVRAITMTAKTAPANAAAPITAAVFLLKFFFTALQISMAQTTQTAAAASTMTSVSHNHESSYNILIRSPYLSLANWKLLFHIHAFVKSRFIPLLSPPLWVWIFQQVRFLRNLFQPLLFVL